MLAPWGELAVIHGVARVVLPSVLVMEVWLGTGLCCLGNFGDGFDG